MNVLVFGEILWDLIEGVPYIGGAPLNFAAHVHQFENKAAIISCLGNDDLGDRAKEIVEEMGVDTSFIQRSTKSTGYVPVNLINGQPEYEIIEDVAYDYIQAEQLDHNNIDSYNTFYFGTIIQRSPESKEALQTVLANHKFDHIFYDVNLRKNSYTQEVIEYSLKQCTILKVNDIEVNILSKMLFGKEFHFEYFCEQISSIYLQIEVVIITAGGKGCQVYSNNKIIEIPAERIDVVDTVGAGDSFSAAFLSSYARSKDPIESAIIGNKVGGFVASSSGAIPKYPSALKLTIKGQIGR